MVVKKVSPAGLTGGCGKDILASGSAEPELMR